MLLVVHVHRRRGIVLGTLGNPLPNDCHGLATQGRFAGGHFGLTVLWSDQLQQVTFVRFPRHHGGRVTLATGDQSVKGGHHIPAAGLGGLMTTLTIRLENGKHLAVIADRRGRGGGRIIRRTCDGLAAEQTCPANQEHQLSTLIAKSLPRSVHATDVRMLHHRLCRRHPPSFDLWRVSTSRVHVLEDAVPDSRTLHRGKWPEFKFEPTPDEGHLGNAPRMPRRPIPRKQVQEASGREPIS